MAVKHTDCISAERQDYPNDCPGYGTKQFDGEGTVMLELWGMQSTNSLPSLPGPIWPEVIELDSVLSIGLTELNYVLTLNWIVWNRFVFPFNWV